MKINLKITTQIQSAATNEVDNIEQNVEANVCCAENNTIIIEYPSHLLNENIPEKNSIVITNDAIEIKRESSSMQSTMIFINKRRTFFDYSLPYGNIKGSIYTSHILNQINIFCLYVD